MASSPTNTWLHSCQLLSTLCPWAEGCWSLVVQPPSTGVDAIQLPDCYPSMQRASSASSVCCQASPAAAAATPRLATTLPAAVAAEQAKLSGATLPCLHTAAASCPPHGHDCGTAQHCCGSAAPCLQVTAAREHKVTGPLTFTVQHDFVLSAAAWLEGWTPQTEEGSNHVRQHQATPVMTQHGRTALLVPHSSQHAARLLAVTPDELCSQLFPQRLGAVATGRHHTHLKL
jgi:hypothetical protein